MNLDDGAQVHFLFETDENSERLVAVRESGVLDESGQGGRFHGEELPKILWDNRKTLILKGAKMQRSWKDEILMDVTIQSFG